MTYPPHAGAGQPPHEGRPAPWQPAGAPQAWGTPSFPAGPVPHHHHLPHGYGLPARPAVPVPYKDGTAAWLFWFFLGGFGAHHFYLGRTGWGVAYAVGFVLSWLTTVVLIGFLGLLAFVVLWVVDATRMSRRLQDCNARIHAVNRSLGLA
ncbi:TM2 domain-containing membrane protein YozV [Geodermatophilus pulveris]|uniref:TM2 domain-containing membrane protein YozV n=1 Tax=Geodermatophilus pulveris TaxID=1564159 RepID=A0A239IE37_9ACTN|nr:TM2 domain-containing protein [Geodermatophilus pulveris]SNS92036.1 TM2 domain-containing membrane protein YozV [Geodermatophilus pulveris]